VCHLWQINEDNKDTLPDTACYPSVSIYVTFHIESHLTFWHDQYIGSGGMFRNPPSVLISELCIVILCDP